MITHLSLDLDGTLVDWKASQASSVFIYRVLKEISEDFGLRRSLSAFMALNHVLTQKRPPEGLVHLTNFERSALIFSQALEIPTEEASQLLLKALRKVFPTLQKYFLPVPGAQEFVSWAKEHYKLVLATNPVWPAEIVEYRVRWAGIDPKDFVFITDSKTMHFCKPDPDYYQEILKLQNVKAQNMLHIGNEIQMDLPASHLGIPVFILNRKKILKKILLGNFNQSAAWKGSFDSLKILLETNQI